MMMVMGMIGMVRPPFVFIWVFVTLTSSKVSSMIWICEHWRLYLRLLSNTAVRG
jgi:hypothetical protein